MLTKVATGVADAGLVYRTDVVGRDVGVLDATGADEVISRYPIGVLDAAPEPDAAAEFVDYVTGDSGRAVLEARGFGAGSTRYRTMSDVRSGTARTKPARVGGRPPGQLPRILAVPALVGIAMLVLPLAALVGRVEWTTVWGDVTSPASPEALWLSVRTALVATGICLVLGVPLALLIARSRPRRGGRAAGARDDTLVLPPMVGGVALLFLLGPTGPGGSLLAPRSASRFRSPPRPWCWRRCSSRCRSSCSPSRVRCARSAPNSSSRQRDWARAGGASSPASRCPLAAPGLIAGTVLCFARAVGEFGATALFAGNAPGVTRTMPLAIYTAFNGSGLSQGPAVALSLLLLMTAILVLLLVRAWRPGAMR